MHVPDEGRGPGTASPATGVPCLSVAAALEHHEALLRAGSAAGHVAVVGAPAVSYGVRVDPESSYLSRARSSGLPTVPRSTGGTGVLHLEGDLLWALVLPRADPRVGRDHVRAYVRLGAPVVTALGRLGIPAAWRAAPALVDDYCTLSSLGEVLVAGEAIVGGAAQHATATAVLHHGGISWRVDRPAVDRLFGLAAGGPSSRLAGIGSRSSGRTPSDVAAAIAMELAAPLPR